MNDPLELFLSNPTNQCMGVGRGFRSGGGGNPTNQCMGVGRGFRSGGEDYNYNNGLELKQTILSLFTEINSLAISSLSVKSL